MRIVIIGNGVAGTEAALSIRAREPDWEVTLISEESDHCISRPALMWVHCGQMSHRDIECYGRDLYDRLKLKRVRARAMGVNVTEHKVVLSGQAPPVPYDKLLIATGSRPRPAPWPGAELPGVGSLVTLQDLQWLEAETHGGLSRAGGPPNASAHHDFSAPDSPYIERATARSLRGSAPKTASVVGGGLIGIEAVEVLLAAGVTTHFFVRQRWYWPQALIEEESLAVVKRLQEHGAQVHLGESLVALKGEGYLKEVETDEGRYDSDLAVVAIGVIPNTSWLGQASTAEGPFRSGSQDSIARAEGGGILVDERLETSAPDVFAAGDCAAVLGDDGEHRPHTLWYTSRDQGRLAGASMLGDGDAYKRGQFYNSAKLMDLEYTTAGELNEKRLRQHPGELSRFFFREEGKVRSTTQIMLRDDSVVGFNFLGRRWDHEVLLRWIRERRSLSWTLTHLDEASFDTEFTPPLTIPEDAWRAHTLDPKGDA